jgi:molecular chaperone GrpE
VIFAEDPGQNETPLKSSLIIPIVITYYFDKGSCMTDSENQEPLRAHEQIEVLQKDLAAEKARADENWDKLLRAMAELENAKRRAEKDVANAHKYALERFIDQLIPVLDSLEHALANFNESHNINSMREGIVLTLKMFNEVLGKFGVVELNPVDAPFNPQIHEAMSMQEVTDKPNNTVITVLQKGYQLNDRVIRPARVIVAKNPS